MVRQGTLLSATNKMHLHSCSTLSPLRPEVPSRTQRPYLWRLHIQRIGGHERKTSLVEGHTRYDWLLQIAFSGCPVAITPTAWLTSLFTMKPDESRATSPDSLFAPNTPNTIFLIKVGNGCILKESDDFDACSNG